MAFTSIRRRGALTLAGAAALAALVACGEDSVDILQPDDLQDDLFRTYVAMGNSITAGYQSGGILDSTQRESYAFYLAEAMGTQYQYQRVLSPGCPAPLDSFGNPNRYGGVTSSSACAGLLPQQLRYVNNVAVPGASVADATNNNTPATNPLTLLLSGGKSQVSRMLDASPTFVSVWIGNNDVLGAATTGLIAAGSAGGVASAGVTPVQTFRTRYQTMVDSIKLAPRLRGGVLVGVADVTAIPYLFSGALLNNPLVLGAISQAAGRPVTVLNCPVTTKTLIGIQIISALRANAALPISCEKIPGQTVAGDLFIVDSTERAALATAVTEYNAFIEDMAEELNFAYFDPNPLLQALRVPAGGNPPAVPPFPNLADPVHPFGLMFSIDGVHPARPAHELIANALIDAIQAKYGVTLPDVTTN